MKTVVELACILATVFVATESRSSPRVATPVPSQICYRTLHECTAEILQNPDLAKVRREQNFENIDNVCEVYEPFEDCMRPNLKFCEANFQRKVSVEFSVMHFLCSDEGRSLIREYKNSQCYDRSARTYTVQDISELCVAEAVVSHESLADEDNQCQILSEIIECVVSEATNECGEAAGRIIEELARRVIEVYSQDECSLNTTGEAVLVEIDHLKRDLWREDYFKRFIDYKKDLVQGGDFKRFTDYKKDLVQGGDFKRFIDYKKDVVQGGDFKRFIDYKKDVVQGGDFKRFIDYKKDVVQGGDFKRFIDYKKDLGWYKRSG